MKYGWHQAKNKFHADDELIKATDLSNVLREVLRRLEQIEEKFEDDEIAAEVKARSGV